MIPAAFAVDITRNRETGRYEILIEGDGPVVRLVTDREGARNLRNQLDNALDAADADIDIRQSGGPGFIRTT